MHRRVLAFSFAVLILVSAAHAAPAPGGRGNGEEGWINSIAAMLDTLAAILKTALGDEEDPPEQHPATSPQVDRSPGPVTSDDPPDEFGGGPEPNG